MTKWGEIKCPRCAEQDALWEGMERALEESDAREARLEARITELEAKLARKDDLVQAAVAAALREVHDAIAEYPLVAPDEMEAQHYDEQIGHSQSIILALIPQDAQAALDRALAAERERCAAQAESHKPSTSFFSDRYWRGVDEAAHSIAVAIREGGE